MNDIFIGPVNLGFSRYWSGQIHWSDQIIDPAMTVSAVPAPPVLNLCIFYLVKLAFGLLSRNASFLYEQISYWLISDRAWDICIFCHYLVNNRFSLKISGTY